MPPPVTNDNLRDESNLKPNMEMRLSEYKFLKYHVHEDKDQLEVDLKKLHK